jgi:hypothetical protein
LLTQVAGGVAKETNQEQWPWKSDSLTDVFYFAQVTSPQQLRFVTTPPQQFQIINFNRYTDNGNGTVTDNRSGLIWLKNANCFGRQDWKTAMQSAANLASGQCGLRDGSRRGMWRLPSKEEWEAMIDKKYVDRENRNPPALSNAAGTGTWKEGDAFSGVQASYYWSSTTYAYYTPYVWYVSLNYGPVYTGVKNYTYYVWPVRGGQ